MHVHAIQDGERPTCNSTSQKFVKFVLYIFFIHYTKHARCVCCEEKSLLLTGLIGCIYSIYDDGDGMHSMAKP
jgi:hypothetical protein